MTRQDIATSQADFVPLRLIYSSFPVSTRLGGGRGLEGQGYLRTVEGITLLSSMRSLQKPA